MRTILSMTTFLILTAMALTLIASQNRADLETRVEGLLLLEHGFEISAIEALAPSRRFAMSCHALPQFSHFSEKKSDYSESLIPASLLMSAKVGRDLLKLEL